MVKRIIEDMTREGEEFKPIGSGISVKIVPDEERSLFYKNYNFTEEDMLTFIRFENFLFSTASRVLPEYAGGYWVLSIWENEEGDRIPMFLLPDALERKRSEYASAFGGDVIGEGDDLTISFAINALACNHFAGLLGEESKAVEEFYTLSAKVMDLFYALRSDDGLFDEEDGQVFFNLTD